MRFPLQSFPIRGSPPWAWVSIVDTWGSLLHQPGKVGDLTAQARFKPEDFRECRPCLRNSLRRKGPAVHQRGVPLYRGVWLLECSCPAWPTVPSPPYSWEGSCDWVLLTFTDGPLFIRNHRTCVRRTIPGLTIAQGREGS